MELEAGLTHVFFVRHAEADNRVKEDLLRPLTEGGYRAAEALRIPFASLQIDRIYASPYRRAIETVTPLAAECGLEIAPVDDFRERRIDSSWIEDFTAFSQLQWQDFSYKLGDGECLAEVQKRNIEALNAILRHSEGLNIVIATHGTALSTIIHYYNPAFGYADFDRLRPKLPYVIRFDFHGTAFQICEEIELAE